MHIFIDPQPDAARSFRERERLFKLPRSSWDDYYSRDTISKGGAVFSRAAKNLALSKEAQALLELPAQVTPNEVIKAILKAHVDLFWNGGIGTYVKATFESHSDVGDRSNDAVRIDARELNARSSARAATSAYRSSAASSSRGAAAGSTRTSSTAPPA